MSGGQKAVVAIIGILAAAAVAIAAIEILGKSPAPRGAVATVVDPSVPSPIASPSPSPSPEALVSERPEKLQQPTQIRASVVSGTTVQVEWRASAKDVRYFQILDNRSVAGKVGPKKRSLVVGTTYGMHCFRVVAVAKVGSTDSGPSKCAAITLTKPVSAKPLPITVPLDPSGGCPPGYVIFDSGLGGQEACVLN